MSISLGIYEKALRGENLTTAREWQDFFAQVPEFGFDFVDISIDETEERTARLEWDAHTRDVVRHAAELAGTMIGGLCLSVHRAIGPGSADASTRAKASKVMHDGIRLCHDLGIPVLQVAGYYCYYEDNTDQSEAWYQDMLVDAVPLAARLGVTLGIENVDGTDVTSIRKIMEFVDAINSPYLQAYPDLGNIAEQGLDPQLELTAGRGHMVAMHAKDVRRGEPRRVAMGTGIVDWDTSFQLLAEQHWAGRLMIEMWNDNASDSGDRCKEARRFIVDKLHGAGLAVA